MWRRVQRSARSSSCLALWAGVRLFHWRDGAREVDLVYNDPSAPAAFEIASSARHERTGLHALAERFPPLARERWLVAPNAASLLPEDSSDGVGLCPLDLFLLVVSYSGGGSARRLAAATDPSDPVALW